MTKNKYFFIIGFLWLFSCKETNKQDDQSQFSSLNHKIEKERDSSNKFKKAENMVNLKQDQSVFKINTNFNNDQIKYSIEVLKNNSEKDVYDQKHFNLPVRIYKGNTLLKSNDHLIFGKRNSCISEGFSTIAVKNNYFTIEHQDCSDYNLLVMTYTTFKVNGDEIYLYKYGESYFDKSDHERDIPTKVWTEKNFGKIKFEDVTTEFLQTLK